MRNYKELKIWQKGFKIALDAFKITAQFPLNEKYGITSQITRAAVSISSNIAEGSSRQSDKDYNRFIQIALGSCFELETQLLIAKSMRFANELEINQLLEDVCDEQKMLSSFMNVLK